MPDSATEAKPASSGVTRRLLAGILFGILVMAVVALAGDLRQVSRQVLDFRWSLFPLVLALTLFNYTLRFFKWHYYLRQVGVHDVPVKESGRLFVGGFPLAVTPGKVGEALKGVWLKDASGIAVAIGVSVVVAERISDGLAVLALSIAGRGRLPAVLASVCHHPGGAAGRGDRLADPPAGLLAAGYLGERMPGCAALCPPPAPVLRGQLHPLPPKGPAGGGGTGNDLLAGRGAGLLRDPARSGRAPIAGDSRHRRIRVVVFDRDRGSLHAARRAGGVGGIDRRHAGACCWGSKQMRARLPRC